MYKKKIKYIVWDWNGTLLNDVSASLETINTMLKNRNKPILSLKEYKAMFRFPIIECYKDLGFDVLDTRKWDAISTEFHNIYSRFIPSITLTTGIKTVLEQLKSYGVSMSILSAAQKDSLNQNVDMMGISHYFEFILGLDNQYGNSKIHLGKQLLQYIDIIPEEILLIGDTDHDYAVASSLNFNCILYNNGHQSKERLLSCNCPIIESIDDIPQILEESL